MDRDTMWQIIIWKLAFEMSRYCSLKDRGNEATMNSYDVCNSTVSFSSSAVASLPRAINCRIVDRGTDLIHNSSRAGVQRYRCERTAALR